MGLADKPCYRQSSSNTMAKVLCLLTWAGLALTAPQRLRSPALGTSGLVDTILAQLDTPINQAIEAALSGLYGQQYSAPVLTSFTGTVSQSPAITVQTSGTVSSSSDSDDDFEGSAFSSEGTFNGFSTTGGQSSSFAANSFSEDSSSTFSSNSFSEDSSSFFSSNSFQTSDKSSGQTSEQSSAVSDQSSIVSQVVNQLSSQIEAAVQAALSGTTTTTTTTTAVVASVSSVSSGSVSSVSQQQTKSQSVSEAGLVSQIISALTP